MHQIYSRMRMKNFSYGFRYREYNCQVITNIHTWLINNHKTYQHKSSIRTTFDDISDDIFLVDHAQKNGK